MRFLDQVGKAVSQGIDRARFEADKFQKTSRIQGELSALNDELNGVWIEMGQRTYDLCKTGTINPASFSDLIQRIEELRVEVTRKEDELRLAQAEAYVEPPPGPAAQSVPVEHQQHPPPPSSQPDPAAPGPVAPGGPPATPPSSPQAGTKTCPACSFQMPAHAVFCPKCGFRVGTAHLS
jgi:hypothetical protein